MFYNEAIVSAVEAEWQRSLFKAGRSVRSHAPCWASSSVPRADNGVYDLMDQAHVIGADCRVEVHHNNGPQFFNMGLCLHWGSNQLGKVLAESIRDAIMPLVRRCGVREWRVVGLPHKDWGRYAAIYDSPHTTVIVEPAWMHPTHLDHFKPENLAAVGTALAVVMRDHWERYHGSIKHT
jgi:hypothetical protein